MYLESLESLCSFYDRADPSTRQEDTAYECWKCCVSRDPPLHRLGGLWIHRCLIQYLPKHIRISTHLFESQKDVWNYLATEFGKMMEVVAEDQEVDVGDQESNIVPGGFLLTQDERESVGEWVHWVSAGSLHVWQRRQQR